jgi:Pregnancy-associated plasma protein-A
MKKLVILASALLFIVGCSKEENKIESEPEGIHFAAHRGCASMHVLEEQLKADPGLASRMLRIEEQTQRAIAEGKLVNGVIEIPVHVNVLYNSAAENITNAQIQSQIDVLNEDFGGTNPDYSLIPTDFSGVAAGDVTIRFTWDPTTGTSRKSTTKRSWRTNDDIKKASKGGLNPTDCGNKLNMWVGVLANNILGYAQFPGGSCATDGVVIHTNAFGRGNYTLFSAFNKGRTATHEVGHWANLRHIWGDATCGSDLVGDTPTHNTSNGGCPAQPHYSTCSGTPREMTMNYMDYTNDACMYMFTLGQKSRMLSVFGAGQPRAPFAQP